MRFFPSTFSPNITFEIPSDADLLSHLFQLHLINSISLSTRKIAQDRQFGAAGGEGDRGAAAEGEPGHDHAATEDDAGLDEGARRPGGQFNRNIFGFSFGLKNRLRFRFDSETCLNYPFMNIFLVQGVSSQNSICFSSQKLKPKFFY